MYSLEYLRQINDRATRNARSAKKTPLVFRGDTEALHRIPYLGDYCPKGWKKVHELFVDKSGFGQPGEPALTWDQFCGSVHRGKGYAIIQDGQFQCYVGVFERVS